MQWMLKGGKGKLLTSVTGYGPLLRDYVYFLLAKLAFHRQHPEFNGLISLQNASTVGAKKPSRALRVRGVHQLEVN